MNIYVGNLPWETEEAELQALFENYGEVESVKLIYDRNTGRMRGFGFVEMEDEGADKAIEELNEQEFNGRQLRVNKAKEKKRGPRRDFDRSGGF